MEKGSNRIAALRNFFQSGSTRPVETSEFMTFWKALSEQEKDEFSSSAVAQGF